METIAQLRQERHRPEAQPNRRDLQSSPQHERKGGAAPDGALNVRVCVSYKDATPMALPLPKAPLRALVNNLGNGIRRARFFHTFCAGQPVDYQWRTRCSFSSLYSTSTLVPSNGYPNQDTRPAGSDLYPS
jgi:hypothetical protein